MKVRSGPRPLAIKIFAMVLGAVASWNLGVDLQYALTEPEESARIMQVSQASARFLVLLIPVSVIWLFASRVAKWFMTIVSAGSSVAMMIAFARMAQPDAESGTRLALGLVMHGLVLLLFTPAAKRWFATERVHHVFE